MSFFLSLFSSWRWLADVICPAVRLRGGAQHFTIHYSLFTSVPKGHDFTIHSWWVL